MISSRRKVCATSFVPPLIAAYYSGFQKHLHLRRLNQQQQRLQVAASRAGAILIDKLYRRIRASKNARKRTRKDSDIF